ncbi:MAG: hypothetical protein NPIRA05_16090 [Nitrospirales bacterium]|nr:MAG: hypothetical protein NPIRA05_16090 [Nitrospirales bacterium]
MGEIDEIRNFSLLWNYFEAEACEKKGKYDSINQYVKRFQATDFNEEQEGVIKDVFEYFKGRYEQNSHGENKLFETLGLGDCLLRELRSELNVANGSVQDKLVPLLKIAFRFRNNFFHGTKEIGEIKTYNLAFENLNKVLVVLNNFVY